MIENKVLIHLIYLQFKLLLKILNFSNFFIPRKKSTHFIHRILDYFKIIFPKNDLLLEDLRSILFYSQFIKKKSLCFDIGANIGRKTRQFLLCGAKVIAVEAQKKCIDILKRNFKNNKNVKSLHNAVGSEIGEGNIFICDAGSELSTF